MPDSIDDETLDKLAYIARLHMRPEERGKFKKDLQGTVSFIEKLQVIDTSNVEPLLSPLASPLFAHVESSSGKEIEARGELVSLSEDEIFANAPEKELPFFCVPKVLS